MSLGDRGARIAVATAVTLLPAALRSRYREQWVADLRDAADVGIRRSEIAWGSLAFAATVDRIAIESERSQSTVVVNGRERLASGLALGAAAVALTHVGSVAGFGWSVQFESLSFVLAFSSFLLASYLVLAPVAAVILVTATRGVRGPVRWAVWLLGLSSSAHLVQVVVDGGGTAVGNVYTTQGMAAFGLSAVSTVVAAVLLVWALHKPSATVRRRPVAAVVGAVLVFGAASVGHDNLSSLLAMQRAASADFLVGYEPTTPSDLTDLTVSLRAAEQTAGAAVTVWTVVALLAVLGLALAGFARGSTRRGAVARSAAVVCVLLVAHASVTAFVQQMSVGSFAIYLPIPDVLLVAGRCGLVLVSLVTVGGLRLRHSAAAVPPVVVPDI